MMWTSHFISPRWIAFLFLFSLGLSGCPWPFGKKQLEVDPLPGVIQFDYSKIRIAQQYSDRAYVHLRLYLLGGPALADPALAGLESLAIETALGAGAGSRSGAAFAAKIESLGGIFGHFTTSEYSVLHLDCLPSEVRETWAVFSSALLEPRFDAADFARIKAQRLASLKGEMDQPEIRLANLAREHTFSGTAAANSVQGTPLSLAPMTVAQVRKYFTKSLLRKCRMVLVTTGPLDGEAVTDLLFDNLDLLAEGDCAAAAAPPAPIRGKPLLAVQQDLPVQYVVATLHSTPGTAERALLAPFLVGLVQAHLDERFAGNSAFGCRPQLQYVPQMGGYGSIRISSPRALACTELLLSELRQLRASGLSETAWNLLRPGLVNRARMQRETAIGMADLLGNCMATDQWESCGQDLNLVQKLSTKQVNTLLRAQLGSISIAYIGDTTRMDRKTLSNF